MSKKSIYKPKTISGFPEWLPEERIAEQAWFDHIRRVFESYGFCSIETPSVEELDVLRAKGEVDKEIYVLERLHKDEDDDGEARLALHFDQTVPLARYVAQNFNDLVFPFKRYQMQRVWRGERPQAGRFREFYQCDIDVIGIDNLPLHFDAEMPAIIWETLSGLPGMENESIQLRISNRKILIGVLESFRIKDEWTFNHVMSCIDKLEKIGKKEVLKLITAFDHFEIDETIPLEEQGPSEIEIIQKISPLLDFLGNKIEPKIDIIDYFKQQDFIDSSSTLVQKGIEELAFVMNHLSHLPEGAVVADLSIVRGLDYYTGTVYETVFTDDPSYGSICSGGRYDDLASSYINKNLPGVGISIGFSRLFDRLRQKGTLDTSRKNAADILMVLPNEEQRTVANDTARTLRTKGYNVEMYHAPQKLQKQLSYAERKGIPYVWFPPFDDNGQHEIKNMNTKEQKPANPKDWTKE